MLGGFRVRRSWVAPATAVSIAVLIAGAGAIASLETGTVRSFGAGLWWAVSLMTTVGFIGAAPTTTAGAVVSVVLMLTGFLLLALISAALASLFVKEDTTPFETRERDADREILQQLSVLSQRLDGIESRLGSISDRRR